MPDVLEPLYQFKPHVEGVLVETKEGLTVMPVSRHKFTLVSTAPHPDAGQPTYLGEIWSGPTDGQRFWLEPGWYERISEWADLV